MVSIEASQALDPGSIPGRRTLSDLSLYEEKKQEKKVIRAQRDLNPQPLGLESKALPLRHGLRQDTYTFELEKPAEKDCGGTIIRGLAAILLSVAGVMVSIVALQAVDPGSIPGRRTFACLFHWIYLTFWTSCPQ